MLTITLLLGIVGFAQALETDNLLSQADAKTSAAHQWSKTFYLDRAADARQNAAQHRELYGKYIARGLTVVARHCKAIAQRYAEIAESYDAIAKGHEDLIKDGPSSVGDLHNGPVPNDEPSP